jgi:hypothetical protein
MSNIDKLAKTTNNIITSLVDDTYITTFLILFFVTYGSVLGAGGKPPEFIIKMFKNPVVRILLLTLLAYMANKNIQVSLGIAIVFYLTQQYIFKQESFEQIKSLEKYQNMFYIEKTKRKE